ncbi:hypothetical protein DENSPDRAFT_433511 [Dentipellis sp. KUC8613]|nr:hypothetical protein DENSPDRAFT_433511 [Dentipellis sp. KUC8613]
MDSARRPEHRISTQTRVPRDHRYSSSKWHRFAIAGCLRSSHRRASSHPDGRSISTETQAQMTLAAGVRKETGATAVRDAREGGGHECERVRGRHEGETGAGKGARRVHGHDEGAISRRRHDEARARRGGARQGGTSLKSFMIAFPGPNLMQQAIPKQTMPSALAGSYAIMRRIQLRDLPYAYLEAKFVREHQAAAHTFPLALQLPQARSYKGKLRGQHCKRRVELKMPW